MLISSLLRKIVIIDFHNEQVIMFLFLDNMHNLIYSFTFLNLGSNVFAKLIIT